MRKCLAKWGYSAQDLRVPRATHLEAVLMLKVLVEYVDEDGDGNLNLTELLSLGLLGSTI